MGKIMKKNVFCVVSHTHWDREWYQPFEVFRLRLVDLIDRLILILEKKPDFVFHLDAQTIVLEDYLEIRPQKCNILKKYIKSGNLVVGPWYLQNDYFLTSGEATIRNLLLGTKIAKFFGKCGKVGYSPDQFGIISQLPQILAGFGIDNCVFGRGYSKCQIINGESIPEKRPAEFLWKGADDTECLAVNMTEWYNNAQNIGQDMEELIKLLDKNAQFFNRLNETPFILLMNGVDHLEAQGDLLEILDHFKKQYPDYDIRQVHYEDYIAAVKNYIREHDISLHIHNGELHDGGDYQMLKGCRSTRSYLKAANVAAQTMLENRLEPLYAMLELAGIRNCYPAEQLNYTWKQLLKNHPHDSICGCSNDNVHRHMEDQFLKLSEISRELLKRGMALLTGNAYSAFYDSNNYIISVLNSSQISARDVLHIQVDFRVEENVKGFRIIDNAGKPVEFHVVNVQKQMRDVYSPVKSPEKWDMDVYHIELYEEGIEPYSYKTYAVIIDNDAARIPSSLQDSSVCLENEYYKIFVNNGCVDILMKGTGRVVHNAFWWEESGDRGDSYVYLDTFEPTIQSNPSTARVYKTRDTPFTQTLQVDNDLTVPECFLFETGKRSNVLATCDVSFNISLHRGNKNILVDYSVKNKAKDHRIRFAVGYDLIAEGIITDSAFDSAMHFSTEIPSDSNTKSFCNANYACVEDGDKGIAVFTRGLHEVEKIDGAMLFTVVRATGAISIIENKISGGNDWITPDNQLQRELVGSLGVYLYTGDYLFAQVPAICTLYKTGLTAFYTSMDSRKYGDCRFAGPDMEHLTIDCSENSNTGLQIAENTSIITVDNQNIMVTALKKSENGKGMIIRLLNLSDRLETCQFQIPGQIYCSALNEAVKQKIGNTVCQLSFRSKEIKTLFIKY